MSLRWLIALAAVILFIISAILVVNNGDAQTIHVLEDIGFACGFGAFFVPEPH